MTPKLWNLCSISTESKLCDIRKLSRHTPSRKFLARLRFHYRLQLVHKTVLNGHHNTRFTCLLHLPLMRKSISISLTIHTNWKGIERDYMSLFLSCSWTKLNNFSFSISWMFRKMLKWFSQNTTDFFRNIL